MQTCFVHSWATETSINCASINNMSDPQGKSKILHSRSYAYFLVITSHRNPLFQLRWCLPVWTCLLERHLYLPLSFSGSLLLSHPPQDSLPPLYMYLPFSIIYSFYYIYNIKIHIQHPHPPSTTISHDTAYISTSNIYNHIQHPHPHPFQHPTSTSMHDICIQHPQPHPHLIWNIYTCIQRPHPYL